MKINITMAIHKKPFSARELLMKSSWKNLICREELCFLRRHGARCRCVCTVMLGEEPMISLKYLFQS